MPRGRSNRPEVRRHALMLLVIGAIVAAGLAASLGTASGSTRRDVRGTYNGFACPGQAGSSCSASPSHFPQTDTLTTEDFNTGAVSGTGSAANGDTWTLTGTLTGDTIALTAVYTNLSYTSHSTGTVDASGNTINGTFTDSSNQQGSLSLFRVSPPVLGKSFDVVPVSGVVLVRPPPGKALGASDAMGRELAKGTGFVALTAARQLPAGSQVDARQGSLQLLAASSANGGKLGVGVFGGGLFKLAQGRSGLTKGLTTLSLMEGDFPGAPSYATCGAHPAADRSGRTARPGVSSRVLQALHARVHGRFRTRGRYSAATVRGTVWDTIDRCDGTLTVVHRGTVNVNDFGRRRTIAVHAGHSYLAKAVSRRG